MRRDDGNRDRETKARIAEAICASIPTITAHAP
ncbi:hypothetical protein B1M_13620 [Burkholderia sp. TJI49]|nr:hypothetical protein B1M_13620 [Burkholderia sp. TJI49]